MKDKDTLEKKSSIYVPGTIRQLVPNTYSPEKRRICFLHLELSYKIKSMNISARDEVDLLDLIDEAFNCGKRMDAKLAEYRKQENA